MKKFKFKLQNVHNVRELRREKEEVILAETQSLLEEAIANLAEIERMRMDAFEAYSRKLKHGQAMSPFEMELTSNHLRSLDQRVREAQKEIEQRKQAYFKQSKVASLAMREEKVTGRLCENQRSKHKLIAGRREQSVVDDLVSAGFARKINTKR